MERFICLDDYLSKDGVGRDGYNCDGIPLLPFGYAYLIKVSKELSLLEVYPWLRRLLFGATVLEFPEKGKSTEIEGVQGYGGAIIRRLAIGNMLIEEDTDALAGVGFQTEKVSQLKEKETQSKASTDPFLERVKSTNEWLLKDRETGTTFTTDDYMSPLHIVSDTFGVFGEQEQGELVNHYQKKSKSGNYKVHYFNRALVGAGNPMKLLQNFVDMYSMPLVELKEEDDRLKTPAGVCYVMNSITNLSRVTGLQDSMMLIRSMLERTTWLSDEMRRNIFKDKKVLGALPTAFFGILHEGVFSPQDISYAETFFDGVIEFGAQEGEYGDGIYYEFVRFPPGHRVPVDDDKHRRIYPDLDTRYFYDPHVLGMVDEKQVENIWVDVMNTNNVKPKRNVARDHED